MKINLLLISFGFTLMLASCCPKEEKCPENIVVNFNGFEQKDADTAQVIMYLANSNFTSVFDSSVKYDAYPNFAVAVVNTYDYKIKLPSTGQQFLINNFKLKPVSGCNGSIFCHRVTNILDSYQVNGVTYTGQSVELHK